MELNKSSGNPIILPTISPLLVLAASNNKYLMTVEEINNSYQEYQDDLALRELHLKLPVTFCDDHLDDLFTLLKEIKDSPPLLTDTDHPPTEKDT